MPSVLVLRAALLSLAASLAVGATACASHHDGGDATPPDVPQPAVPAVPAVPAAGSPPSSVAIGEYDLADTSARTLLSYDDTRRTVYGDSDRPMSIKCTRQVVGECAFVSCDNAGYDGNFPYARVVDAGEILFRGGTLPSPGLRIDDTGSEYMPAPGQSLGNVPLVHEDSVVRVSAAGARFPAFDVVLDRPTAIEVQTPGRDLLDATPGATGYLVSGHTLMDADYVVTWSAPAIHPAAQRVTLTIGAFYGENGLGKDHPYVECSFAGASSGTIPAEISKRLGPVTDTFGVHVKPEVRARLTSPSGDVLVVSVEGKNTAHL